MKMKKISGSRVSTFNTVQFIELSLVPKSWVLDRNCMIEVGTQTYDFVRVRRWWHLPVCYWL